MPSVFYDKRFNTPMPVSFLLMERVSAYAETAEEDTTVSDVVKNSLVDCKLAKSPTEDQVLYAANKLFDTDSRSTIEKLPITLGFASSYGKWVQDLGPEAICMYAADYNLDTAEFYYCDVDYDHVIRIAEDKLKREGEMILVQFECALYGFGGSYNGSGSSSSSDGAVDMTKEVDPIIHRELASIF